VSSRITAGHAAGKDISGFFHFSCTVGHYLESVPGAAGPTRPDYLEDAPMKLRHLVLAACLSSVIAAGGAFAAPAREGGPDPARRAEYLQKSLQLSAEQTTKLQQLFEKNAQQRSALEKKYSIADRDKFRDELRRLRETQDKEFEALLTPAQREALSAQKARHDKRGMHDKRGRGDGHRGERGPRDPGQAPKAEKPAA
jgi:Spy/CpxP family protein refolding chaperone